MHSTSSLIPLALSVLGAAAQAPAPRPTSNDSPHEGVTGGTAASGPVSRFWWSDFDGDGNSDAFVVHPGRDAVLLRGHGDGSFEDVTARAGLAGIRGVHQALWQDVDGDGAPELYLVVPGGTSKLHRSNGGVFEDITGPAGLALDAAVLQGEWQDVNGDARADLHLSTSRGELVFRNLGVGRFQEVDLGLAAPVRWSERLDEWTRNQGEVPPLPPGAPTTDGGTEAATAPGGVNGTGTRSASAGAPFCWDSIEDQATMNCLTASSTPTLGALYPLGVEFNIDGAGRVGIGTLAPGTSLDVVGSIRASGQLVSTAASGAPLAVSSTAKVTGLNADLLDGLDASAFSQFGLEVDSIEIANDTILSSDIKDGTIGSVDLGFGVVGNAQLAADSVDTLRIQDGGITAADLAPRAVDSATLQDGSIFDVDVAASAAIQGTKVVPDFGAQDLATTGGASFGPGGPVSAVRGIGPAGPTSGHLGPVGTNDFDGVSTADWVGLEIGVAGISTGPSDTDNFGVLGHSNHVGVRGENSVQPQNVAELGTTVAGIEASGEVAALLGQNTFDPTSSVQLGTIGFGVVAEGSSAGARFGPSNSLDGVRGETTNGSGYAVFARNQATTGTGIAVRATTSSSSGQAVSAIAFNNAGVTYGVRAEAQSTQGRALFGRAYAQTGINYGVYGETESSSGVGVYGTAERTTGFTYGVLGQSLSSSGRGVRGEALSFTGTTYGVQGRTWSPSGWGIISYGSSGATGQKNFIQPHPGDPSKEIRFTSLEGNESGTYFRGTGQLVNGRAVIGVPEEFRLVSEADGLTVSLTAMGPATLWVESKDLDAVVVRGSSDVAFDYMVNGVRRGWSDYQAVHPNQGFVPEQRGVPFGTQYPPAFRQLLVDNGILNADFTPNEATASALGWELSDPLERELAEATEAALEVEHEAFRAEQAQQEAELEAQAEALRQAAMEAASRTRGD